MEQLIEDVTRGNVTEVKVMLASVVLALAAYQVLLAGVIYGRLGAHAVVATILPALFAVKVRAVRLGGRLGRLLPLLGVSLLALFGLTWLTSAGDFLGVS